MDWIAVGLSVDVPRGLVMPATLNDTDLAVWRDMSGMCHAWGDRCPHRGMRLSHGFVRGDQLACIYHGWQYGQDGACTRVPAHPKMTPPKSICAKTYSCIEQGGVIWASLTGSSPAPTNTNGLQAVRSLEVDLSAPEIAAFLDVEFAPVLDLRHRCGLVLALQPATERSCMVHVLCDMSQNRRAASLSAEDLRDTLEGVQT